MNYSFHPAVSIGPITLGSGSPLIIAEIGGNHGGQEDLAAELIMAAARAGADAVKLQVYRTRQFLSRTSRYYDELAGEELTPASITRLRALAADLGVLFLASAFDQESLDLLATLDIAAIKIASGDLNHWPLLEAAAALKRPVILSTGAAELAEIDQALATLARVGVFRVVLLQCTALYPCPEDQVNLKVIPVLAERYGLPVGFSDHTLGIDAALAAVALGAVVIEKHFTIDTNLPGGDNTISCRPDDFAKLIQGCRRIYQALGSSEKHPTSGEIGIRQAIRRSVVASRNIFPGEILTAELLSVKRPGDGLPPEYLKHCLGRTAIRPIWADHPVQMEDID